MTISLIGTGGAQCRYQLAPESSGPSLTTCHSDGVEPSGTLTALCPTVHSKFLAAFIQNQKNVRSLAVKVTHRFFRWATRSCMLEPCGRNTIISKPVTYLSRGLLVRVIHTRTPLSIDKKLDCTKARWGALYRAGRIVWLEVCTSVIYAQWYLSAEVNIATVRPVN
jgi:hypothetical protein